MGESYGDKTNASRGSRAENQAQPNEVIQEIAEIARLLVSYSKTLFVMNVLLQGLDERMKYLTRLIQLD
jgi:hypothetical protein